MGYVEPGGPAGGVLKVRRARLAVMANFRALRFLVLEGGLALWADTLRLGIAGPATQLGVTDGAVIAEMTGDGEIIHSADGSVVHWRR
ncbi:MAG TPA: hypothetical protein VMU41_02375 [Candidatus Binataceae bacterium]|nr:hypothetical protein [Candidatus Binataceae bacterium]